MFGYFSYLCNRKLYKRNIIIYGTQQQSFGNYGRRRGQSFLADEYRRAP